jgi:hypothetical protein
MRVILAEGEREIADDDVLHVDWHGRHGAYEVVTLWLRSGEQITGLVKADDAEPELPPVA